MGYVCGDNCKRLKEEFRIIWQKLRDDYEDKLWEEKYTRDVGYCPYSMIPGNTSSYSLVNTIMDSVVEKVAPLDFSYIIGGKFSIIKYSAEEISLSSVGTSGSSVVDKCSIEAWFKSGSTMEQECEGEDCLNAKANSALGQIGRTLGPYILPCIALLTFVCLLIALGIFARFRCLWCDRVVLQCQLMLAMLLRMVTSTIRHYMGFYKKVEWICKALVTLDLYAQCAVVAWTFVQGIFLHNKITRVTRIFKEQVQRKLYFLIGWGFPLALITAFDLTVEVRSWATECWPGYGDNGESKVLAWFLGALLMINLGLLLNVVRILVTKGHRSPSLSEAIQFRRSVKATFVLTFLHCVYYLPVLFSVDGNFRKWLKMTCFSCQGIYIAIMLCFFNKDVRGAILGIFKRFWARQDAYVDHMQQRAQVPRLTHRQMTLPPFFSTELPIRSEGRRFSSASTLVAGANDGASSVSDADEETTLIE